MKNAKRRAIALLALASLTVAFVSVDLTTSFAGAPEEREKCLHGEDGIFYGVHLHADLDCCGK